MSKGKPKYEECPVDPATGAILETAEIRAFGLVEIRKMMAEAKAKGEVARFPREDDQFLLAFLRARKYKVDKAFSVLKGFSEFWFDPKYRHIIEGTSAERCRAFHEVGAARLSDHRDLEGNYLGYIYGGRITAEAVNFEEQIRLGVYGLGFLLEHEDMQLRGVTYVETFEGFSLGAAMGMRKLMDSAQQKELMGIFMDKFPLRIRHIYVLHQPWYFSMIWGIAKIFFKKKITERVQLFGSDVAALHARVPADRLPTDISGTMAEPRGAVIDRLAALQRRNGGSIGGFRVPFSVDAPMAATATAPAAGAGAAVGGAGAGAVAVGGAGAAPVAPASAAVAVASGSL